LQGKLTAPFQLVRRGRGHGLDPRRSRSLDLDVRSSFAATHGDSKAKPLQDDGEPHLPDARVELSSPLDLVKEVAVGVRHVLSPESFEILAVVVAMDVIPDVDIHRIEFRCGNRRFEQLRQAEVRTSLAAERSRCQPAATRSSQATKAARGSRVTRRWPLSLRETLVR
jgi:hypothetical protein